MKNATRSEAGQGQFTRMFLNNYFKKASTVDQRAMLAAALPLLQKSKYPEV